MSENSDINKTDTVPSADDGVISLDDLDVILTEEDPGFVEEMNVISKDQNLKNIEVEITHFDNLEDDKSIEDANTNETVLNEKVASKASIKIKLILTGLQNKISAYKALAKKNTWQFLTISLPAFSKASYVYTLNIVKELFKRIKFRKDQYTSLPEKVKKGLLTAIIFTALLITGAYYSLKNNWLPQIYQPLVKGHDEVAKKDFSIGEKERWIEIYRAFPQKEYFILLDKVVVNLKRQNAYENPMTVIEFYLELDSHDTAVEIEDRKVEIIDLAQRTVEEFTYEEISSKTGILKLKSNLRSEVNNALNQGRVHKVFINTIVTKK